MLKQQLENAVITAANHKEKYLTCRCGSELKAISVDFGERTVIGYYYDCGSSLVIIDGIEHHSNRCGKNISVNELLTFANSDEANVINQCLKRKSEI